MPVIKLRPALKDYLWGGTQLADRFFLAPTGTLIAESWALSTHPSGPCTIAETGVLFPDYLESLTQQQLGQRYSREAPFPFLIKLIDAAQPLSVQVHPNDEQAKRMEGSAAGKTEIWHIIDAAADACIYRGLKPGVTRATFESAIKDGSVCDLLIRYNVRPGETYFIPAGTVHAIGSGCLICEVQQNSDITYRVFDYNRTDADGNRRPLHMEQALAVIDFSGNSPPKTGEKSASIGKILCDCDYFYSILLDTAKTAALPIDPGSFVSLVVLRGSGALRHQAIVQPAAAGDSFFITADCEQIFFTGQFEAIITVLPQPPRNEETLC